ncbi:MAG: EamA family transporter [Ignavibacteriales bacterium]|nr:EamA family transporter [Ignavibacteriales bacterium]
MLYTISAVLFWSTAATAFKLTLAGMNNIQLLFYSAIFSTMVLFLLLLFNVPKEIKNIFSVKYLKDNLLLGLINPFLYYLVLFKAYSLLPAQEAMPLNYTWPIIISLFSVLFLKAKITPKIILGMVIAFFGVIIIGTRGELFSLKFNNLFGVILAFGSSFIWAAYWILNLKDSRSELSKLFAAFLFGTIYISIYVFFFDDIRLQNYNYLFGAIYIGLFEMGITFYLWLKGLQLSSNKAKTATLVYLSPFLSMFFIALILKEDLFLSSMVGLVFIVSGISIQSIFFEKGKIRFRLK